MIGITDRQKELNLKTGRKVAVIGCGGVGSWVSLFLALAGVDELLIADPDILEPHNLNRLPFQPSFIGSKKVDALGDFLEGLREDIKLMRVGEAITPTLLDVFLDGHIVCDCTDDLEAQKAIADWCKKKGIEYIRVGVTTNHITVSSGVKVWSTEPPRRERCGVTIPSWVAPCTLAASYATAKILKYPGIEKFLDVGDETKDS